MRFRLNDKQVMFEKFDEEILAININAGIYYSLPDLSGRLWGWIIDGADIETVKQTVVNGYDGDRAAIESAVDQFVDKLATEQLIVPDPGPLPERAISIDDSLGRRPFATPTIEIYSDLQDLLLLDPIHDVDERGWPVHKLAAPPEAKA